VKIDQDRLSDLGREFFDRTHPPTGGEVDCSAEAIKKLADEHQARIDRALEMIDELGPQAVVGALRDLGVIADDRFDDF